MNLFDLRCEYRSNPLCLDVSQPRLSWKLATNRRHARQTACQVLVASSLQALAAGGGDLRDSGRAESAKSVHVPTAGEPLVSRQRAWWKAQAWDETGQLTPFSAPAWGGGGPAGARRLAGRMDRRWLYRVVTGIQPDPGQPGHRHIILWPRPGGLLTWAKVSYESPYGRIESAWRLTDDGLEWQVTVLPDTTATAHVPASPGERAWLDGQPVEEVVELAAGSYEFVVARQGLPPLFARRGGGQMLSFELWVVRSLAAGSPQIP